MSVYLFASAAFTQDTVLYDRSDALNDYDVIVVGSEPEGGHGGGGGGAGGRAHAAHQRGP